MGSIYYVQTIIFSPLPHRDMLDNLEIINSSSVDGKNHLVNYTLIHKTQLQKTEDLVTKVEKGFS
jgi:hypothetical protein